MTDARDRFDPGAVEHRMHRAIVASSVALALSGCSAVDTLDFYWQGAAGQMDLITRARPITEVIEQSGDTALASRLDRVRDIRAFASRELGLPDNGSYTKYTDLGR